MIFSKRNGEANEAAETPDSESSGPELNPDFNFWENRGANESAPQAVALRLDKEQDAAHIAAATLNPAELTPPDAAHTLLNRGRWVRPWGLRNFVYSFVAFIGVQVILVLVLSAIVVAQSVGGDLSGLLDDSAALSKKVTDLAQTPGGLVAGGLSMYVVWLGFMWWSTRYRGARSWAKDFGLWFKKRDVLIGIGTAGALFGLQILVIQLIQNLAPDQNYSGLDNGEVFSNQSALAFFVVSLGIAGIIGPICEELYFRGYFLTGIQRWFGRYVPRFAGLGVNIVAIVVSSVLFGSLHFQGVDTFGQILVVFLTGGIGVVLAIYRVAFKRLGPGIITHISYNTASLLIAYFTVSGH